MRHLLTMLAALACAPPAHAEIARSSIPKRQYAAEHPYPSTGKRSPAGCSGFVLDHRHALCAGGADTAENLQWMRVDEARAKDRVEKQYCAWLRKRPAP